MKKILLFLAILLSSNIAEAGFLNPNHFYGFARTRNYASLQRFSKWIDVADNNGYTAVCLALKNKDTNAYKLLVKYGANPKPACLRSEKVQEEVKGSTNWLATGGLVAVGVGVAAAAGGGGGGGSSTVLEEDKGETSYLDNEAVTDTDNGQEIIGKVVNIKTPQTDEEFFTNSNNETIKKIVDSKSDVAGMVSETAFVANAISIEGVNTANITVAQRGGGDVYGIKGPQGAQSAYGLQASQGDYISANMIDVDYEEYEGDEVRNAVAGCTGKSVGDIIIRNTGAGKGNIYGMQSNAINGSVLNSFAESNTAETIGTIVIENINSNKNVYGISSVSEVTNAEAYENAKAFGDISIKNIGNGNVYGLNADEYETVNAYASENGEAVARIDITNKGNGDVYGINSKEYASNVITDHELYVDNDDVAKAKGIINIENTGDGNVYGIKSKYISNVDSYYNGYGEGVIRISNSGSGDAYGMYGEGVENANAYLEETENMDRATAKGYINIVNKSSGNAYGMFGLNVYNENGVNEDGTANKIKESVVEIANIDKGLAVGLYAKENEATNTGDIKIHNLGDGTAVGIYVEKGAFARNTGNIVIDREKFVDDKATDDKSDDVTYTANSNKGGMAIGIYGSEDSHITNEGTIVIKNAKKAYGIYSEGNLVTNIGTIEIDGNTNHTNAIKLNGGQLLQDGKLIARNDGNEDSDDEEDDDVTNPDDNEEDDDVVTNPDDNEDDNGTNPDDNEDDDGISSEDFETNYLDKEAITDADNGKEIVGKRVTIHQPDTDAEYLANSNNSTIKKIVESKGEVAGMVSETAFVANALSFGGEKSANIIVAQRGSGDVYGIKGPQNSYVNIAPDYDDDEAEGELSNAISVDSGRSVGNITIRNTGAGNGNIYGMQSNATNIEVINSMVESEVSSAKSTGNILIENLNSDKNVYGMSGAGSVINAEGDDNAKSFGYIDIKNIGNGDVYGIKAKDEFEAVYNVDATENSEALARIDIANKGNGDVYGIASESSIYNAQAGHDRDYYDDKDAAKARATVNIENVGDGDIYGLKALGYVYNAYSYYDSNADGLIRINNKGSGDAYGMHGYYLNNAYAISMGDSYFATAEGRINIINQGLGNAYGMYGGYVSNNSSLDGVTQESVIEIANIGDGLAVGMYSKGEYVENCGDIKIHNLGEGAAIGIYADGESGVVNYGTITIDREDYIDDKATDDTSDDEIYTANSNKGGMAIGIYGAKDSYIENFGTIIIKDAENAYGIYFEGDMVENNGTIVIDGNTNHANAIKLNGGQLLQDGKLIDQRASTDELSSNQTNDYVFNLDDMGGSVVATENGTFEVDGAIAGNLTMSSDIVAKGFNDVYTTENTIDAQDTSNLNLLSQSALFDASLAENNSDVNLKMKAFEEVVDNKSLAGFLQNNYALENNEEFYNTLKKQETMAKLNDSLNDLTGQKMFSRFADEDLMMMRELTFDVNNKLFMNEEDHLEISGSVETFNFNGNSGSNSRYALTSHNYGNYKLGLNYGIAEVSSYDSDNDNRRKEMMFHIGMPVSYDKQGFKFITTPQIGYVSGTYDRKGLNNENYDGHIEKTMIGLMNEARYPVAFDNWTISPSVEFNVVDYATKGYEKGGTNPLNLDYQHNYSMEVGVGVYANAEHKFSKNSKLSFTGGVALYHEFADPYSLQVSMDGMNGKFDIRDENRSDDRAVIRSGLKFDNGNMSLGANIMSYVDNELRTNATLEFKYNF